MIDTKALRSRVLDLAIQGKLTEQLESDGTAEELWQKIQAEKQRLIKEGKLKKEKPLPEITPDEIPFEIPENWKYVTLSSITSEKTLNDGDWVLSHDMVSEGAVKLIQLGSIGNCMYIEKGFKYLTEEHFRELNGKQIYSGYLLINRMVADRMLECIIPEIDGILMTAVDVCWIAPQPEYYDLKFLMYALASGFFQKRVKELGYGTTRFRISKLNLINIFFPFPPLAEQKRIVARVEEIFRLLDIIDAAQEQYAADAESLKAKLITLGIQGRLTEQLASDGTAEELYQQIQAEQQRLIKEGKIKREKPLPEIKPEEVPFEIPGNWKWVRWGEIVNIVSARRVHQSDWKTEGVPFYRAREIARLAENGYVDNDLFISEELYNEFSKSGIPHAGDIMISAVGTLGKAYVVKANDKFYYKDASVLCIENIGRIIPEFLIWVMRSDFMRSQIASNSGGTTVDTLTMVRMIKYLFPLPPLAEQKRIAETLERVLGVL